MVCAHSSSGRVSSMGTRRARSRKAAAADRAAHARPRHSATTRTGCLRGRGCDSSAGLGAVSSTLQLRSSRAFSSRAFSSRASDPIRASRLRYRCSHDVQPHPATRVGQARTPPPHASSQNPRCPHRRHDDPGGLPPGGITPTLTPAPQTPTLARARAPGAAGGAAAGAALIAAHQQHTWQRTR